MGAGNLVRFGLSADDKISGTLDKVRDKFDRLGTSKGFTSVMQGVGMGVGIQAWNLLANSVDDVVGYLSNSVQAASDFQETVSKGRVIFGDNAAVIEKWADTASTAFGQSKRQAIDTASTFAGLFDTVGIAADKSTDYAQNLTELGSDLASFFNTDVQTAIDAIRSGLAGESEPLRRFNVFLSETAVKAKAAEMGLGGVGRELTEAEKATARYALIMEQTGAAQGDFARTSDGLANTQRSLGAMMEELSVEVGEALLPAIQMLATYLKDELVPALSDAAKWVKENEGVWEFFGDVINMVVNGPGKAGRDLWEREMTQALEASQQAMIDTADSWDTGSERIGMANESAKADARAFAAAWEQSKDDFWVAMDEIVGKLQTSRDEMASIINNTLDDIYDPEMEALRLLQIEQDKTAQNAILNSEESTEEQKTNARIRLLELEKEERAIRLLQVAMGEAKDEGHEMAMGLTADWAKAGPAARRQISLLLDDLARLVRLSEAARGISNYGSDGRSGPSHRHSGGPVEAGRRYWVGESGPEELILNPGGGGFVIPNGATGRRMEEMQQHVMVAGAGGAGAVSVVLNIDSFYGTEDNLRELNRRLGETVRAATVRR